MGHRLGSKLKRYISEGKGASAQRELLGVMQISEAEIGSMSRPKTRESLQRKLDAVKDIDIMDLWESLMGSVRTERDGGGKGSTVKIVSIEYHRSNMETDTTPVAFQRPAEQSETAWKESMGEAKKRSCKTHVQIIAE